MYKRNIAIPFNQKAYFIEISISWFVIRGLGTLLPVVTETVYTHIYVLPKMVNMSWVGQAPR
jgi:hypothetical protein